MHALKTWFADLSGLTIDKAGLVINILMLVIAIAGFFTAGKFSVKKKFKQKTGSNSTAVQADTLSVNNNTWKN